MLVDALDHAVLDPQGVVEQLAVAVGGALDQLGEQPSWPVESHAPIRLSFTPPAISRVRRRSFWLRT